jgi:hypothetical protein
MINRRHTFISFALPMAILAAIGVGCSATPASRTVSSSESTTQNSAGGQTRTTVSESNSRGANGSTITERTETTRTTTPAQPTSAQPQPQP